MKCTNTSILPILIVCLSFFDFSCQQKQARSFACAGFQDTILHKFVYKTTDVPPAPVGGLESLNKLIAKNLKPDSNDFGTKIVAFVVEPNGAIDGERLLNDPSGSDDLLSKQILNISRKVKWKPGICNGEKVPFLYRLPLIIDPGE